MPSKTTQYLPCSVLFILLLCTSLSAKAQESVSLLFEYTAPTTRVDGTALPASEIAGYELRSSNGGLIMEIAPDVTEYVAESFSLDNGVNCFELSTKDTNGRISEPTKTCISAVPNAPVTFTVKIK